MPNYGNIVRSALRNFVNRDPLREDELSLFIRLALKLSLEKREGQFLTGSLIYFDSNSAPFVLRFKSPIETDAIPNTLAAFPGGLQVTIQKSSVLAIAALVTFEVDITEGFTAIEFRLGGPGIVHVYTLGCLFPDQHGYIADPARPDRLLIAELTPFSTRTVAAEWSIRAICERVGIQRRRSDGSREQVSGEDIRILIQKIEQVGRGGTVIIDDGPIPSNCELLGARFAEDYHWATSMASLAEGSGLGALRFRNWMMPAFDILANMTRADGALFFDRRFNLRGYAVRVAGSAPSIVRLSTAFDGVSNISPALCGGTRHQAALAYIHSNHNALAFVVSEDGPVSMIHWSENSVEVTKDIMPLI